MADSFPPFDRNGSPLLLRGARVYTLEGKRESASGLLLEEGRIRQVFSSEEDCRRYADGNRELDVMDLSGQVILPGFWDAHTHLEEFGQKWKEIDLDGVTSPDEVRQRIQTYLSEQDGEGWLKGRGWNPNQFQTRSWPHWKDLEPLDVDRPIVLYAHDHHACWLNRQALDRLRITADTPVPEGGEIRLDETGEPTGILKETAMDLLGEADAGPGPDETVDFLENAFRELLSNGIVGVHDIGDWDVYQAHRQLRQDRDQPIPRTGYFCMTPGWADVEEAHLSPDTDDVTPLTLLGLKVFADGTLGSQTASLLEPYSNALSQPGPTREEEKGTLIHSPEELRNWVHRARRQGFPTAIHAIGDRAGRVSLDAFEAVEKQTHESSLPWNHRIEHAQLLHPAEMDRFAELNVTASVQPCHIFQDRAVARRVWGGDRPSKPFPFASLRRAGAPLLFGTDVPVEKPDPLRNMYAALHRGRPDEQPWMPDERISRRAAFEYTCQSPARYMGYRGSIREDTRADLVVLSGDPFSGEPEKWMDLDVNYTFIDGSIVYSEQ